MWFRRPRVKDMPWPEDVGCLSDAELDAASEPGPYDAPYAVRSVQEMQEWDENHPLSQQAFLMWHAKTATEHRERQENGVSVFEGVEITEAEDRYGDVAEHLARKTAGVEPEPEPQVVAGTPPTFADMLRTTQDVWVHWLRGKRKP